MTSDAPQNGEAQKAQAVQQDDADDYSVPGLWETARWFLRWLIAICGEPGDVAALNVLARKERRDILHWLRPIEAIVRRLLVAEAAQIAKDLPPVTPVTPGKRRPRPSLRRAVFQQPDNSEQWSVRFQLAGRTGQRRAARRAVRRGSRWRPPAPGRPGDHFERIRRQLDRQWKKENPCPRRNAAHPRVPAPGEFAVPSEPVTFFSPWPLAGRIEAVRRVLENRESYVKRLARRLARRQGADIKRVVHVCRPPPGRSPYAQVRYGETSIRHASGHALQALAPFDTS